MEISDELEQVKKDGVKAESTKELQTAWDDAKANIRKFLLVLKVCR